MQDDIISALEKLRGTASNRAQFFKTGKGDYAEHEKFLDISVPAQRKIAKSFRQAPFSALTQLLASQWHEHRLTAVLILVYQYEASDARRQEEIVQFYLSHTDSIQSWDVVDCSAAYILGPWFLHRDRQPIHGLFSSEDLWKRRIAILTNWHFIRHLDFADILSYLPILIQDSRDLIQKATGWMLREMGRRDAARVKQVLDTYATRMPRTMLRYAIERLSRDDRTHYLSLAR